jgi:hypothetical protein
MAVLAMHFELSALNFEPSPLSLEPVRLFPKK